MINHNAIAESNNFIVLDQYSKKSKVSEGLPREIALRQKQHELLPQFAVKFSEISKRQYNRLN